VRSEGVGLSPIQALHLSCRSPLHHACSAHAHGDELVQVLLLIGGVPVLQRAGPEFAPWDHLFTQATILPASKVSNSFSVWQEVMPRPSIWTSTCSGVCENAGRDQHSISAPCPCNEPCSISKDRSQTQLQWPPWVTPDILHSERPHESKRHRPRSAEVLLAGMRRLHERPWTACGKPVDGSNASFAEVCAALISSSSQDLLTVPQPACARSRHNTYPRLRHQGFHISAYTSPTHDLQLPLIEGPVARWRSPTQQTFLKACFGRNLLMITAQGSPKVPQGRPKCDAATPLHVAAAIDNYPAAFRLLKFAALDDKCVCPILDATIVGGDLPGRIAPKFGTLCDILLAALDLSGLAPVHVAAGRGSQKVRPQQVVPGCSALAKSACDCVC
jgi:hypothetical protein